MYGGSRLDKSSAKWSCTSQRRVEVAADYGGYNSYAHIQHNPFYEFYLATCPRNLTHY